MIAGRGVVSFLFLGWTLACIYVNNVIRETKDKREQGKGCRSNTEDGVLENKRSAGLC